MPVNETPLWILVFKSRDKALIEGNHHIFGSRHHDLKEHGKHNLITNTLLTPNKERLVI